MKAVPVTLKGTNEGLEIMAIGEPEDVEPGSWEEVTVVFRGTVEQILLIHAADDPNKVYLPWGLLFWV